MTKNTATTGKTTPSKLSAIVLPSLRTWNIWLAGLHAIQGAAILLLSMTKLFPVQTGYLTSDPVSSELAGHTVLATASRHLFDINLAYLVAAFFFIAAIAHGLIATVCRTRYEAGLKKGVNKARWIEYAFSSGVMLSGIALLTGVTDLAALKMLFVFGLLASAMGLVMELMNQGRGNVNWLPYGAGCIAALVPWAVFAIYLWGAGVYGSGDVPAFVYWIYGTMFLLSGGFAATMYLHYKKVGKWKNYLYAERTYMIIGLVAKTALAWQIFAGALS